MDSFTAVGQPAVAGQPDAAGWLVACDPFPQVYLPSAGIPGAMQDLIRHGESLSTQFWWKKGVPNFHQEQLKWFLDKIRCSGSNFE